MTRRPMRFRFSYFFIFAMMAVNVLLFQNCTGGGFDSGGGSGSDTSFSTPLDGSLGEPVSNPDTGEVQTPTIPMSYKLGATAANSVTITTGETLSLTPSFPVFSIYAYSYLVTPALPDDFKLDATSGRISGKTTKVLAATNYKIVAFTNLGAAATNLILETKASAPRLAYNNATSVFYGAPFTQNAVAPVSFYPGPATIPYKMSITPALPAGLTLSEGSALIQGTPTAPFATQQYTVHLETSVGSVDAPVTLAYAPAPGGGALSLPYSNLAIKRGEYVVLSGSYLPTGLTVTSWQSSPTTGLGFGVGSDNTGHSFINMKSDVVIPATDYTFKVVASDGNTYTGVINITVVDAPPKVDAPSAELIAHRGAAFSWFAITPPLYTLPEPVKNQTYSISPATLPPGLSFDPTLGKISGTPTGNAPVASYTVTAKNPAGASSMQITLQVVDPLPAVSYPPLYVTKVGKTLDPEVPFVGSDSGAISKYGLSKPIPGLSFDSATGVFTGALSSEGIYSTVVSAGGPGGSVGSAMKFVALSDVPQSLSVFCGATCSVKTDRGLMSPVSVLSEKGTGTPWTVPGFQGDVQNHLTIRSQNGNFSYLQSSAGSVYVTTTNNTTFAPIPGLDKNVKKILPCNSDRDLCVVMNDGKIQELVPPTTLKPIAVLPTKDVLDMSANAAYACVVIADGTVKCAFFSATPGTPPTDLGVKGAVRFISVLGMRCVVLQDNGVTCVVGDGSLSRLQNFPAPAKILDKGSVACGLSTTGGVRCLAGGNSGNKGTPVDVPGLTAGVIDIAFADNDVCGLMGDGSVLCAHTDPNWAWPAGTTAAAKRFVGFPGAHRIEGGDFCLHAVGVNASYRSACTVGGRVFGVAAP